MTSAATVPVEDVTLETSKDEKPLVLRLGAELLGTFVVCFAVYVMCTFGSIIFSLNLAYVALGTGFRGLDDSGLVRSAMETLQSGEGVDASTLQSLSGRTC